MNSVLERVYEIGIIPVIAFNSVDEAIPLCKALMDGGLPAAEDMFPYSPSSWYLITFFLFYPLKLQADF